ncbi:MAG TPA: shikimate dehydrogenase [Microbacterium sp.]|nr:shikimate dehydrogenase [Microbacterium sp.]
MTAAIRRPPSALVGLVGEGVVPSLTPPMHELEGGRHGIHYVYRTIDLAAGEGTEASVDAILASARRLGFTGLNITHPVKQTIVPLLDELAPSAQRVGAVNTVVFDGDRTVGHNTDVTGFAAAFDEALPDAAEGLIILIGAGGAGAAVCGALTDRTVERLFVVDVDMDRARALAESTAGRAPFAVGAATPDDLPALLGEAAGVVNATPMGMAAHPGMPIDVDLLGTGTFVADIVYRPVETALLRAARLRGLRVMSGLGMAMHQAADAFEIFTGEAADRAAMLDDLRALVAAEAITDPPPAPHSPRGTLRGEHP